MGKLIYSAIASLDGYIEDGEGKFDWAAPDDELHAFVNELLRPIATHLYGRRMYETMAYWETVDLGAASPVAREFAEIWRASDKVVYSRVLDAPATPRTRLERAFDPDRIRRLKQGSEQDITIGGSELAGQALAADLVDECHLFFHPIIVGAGKRALPHGLRARLELLDERRFGGGVVHLHYGVTG